MVVVMQERATDEQVQSVIAQLSRWASTCTGPPARCARCSAPSAGTAQFDTRLLEVLDGVQEVLRITEPYKLASRTFKPDNTVITIGDVRIGGDEVIVMAGPCSAETEEQVEATAAAVQARRRQGPARRRLQAAQLALQLPGPGRGGPAHAAVRGRPAQPEAHHPR